MWSYRRAAQVNGRPSGKTTEGEAGVEGSGSAEQAGDGGAGAAGVDGDLAGAVEIPADEWDQLPVEPCLGEDAELEGKAGEEGWRVHVTEVVGGVYGGLAGVAGFSMPRTVDAGEGEAQAWCGPRPGATAMLLGAGGVPKAADE